MGFGLDYSSGNAEDIVPVVKFDARAGRIFRIDRADGISNPVDITRSFKAVLDLENVEVGYMLFAAGVAPAFALVKLGEPMPVKPNADYKQGIRVMLKLGKDCGSDVRELATTAKVALRGLDELHSLYERSRERQAGQLPVVVLKDTIPVVSEGQGQKSTNYQPVFEVVGWAPRPSDLVFKPRGAGVPPAAASNGSHGNTPSTGPARGNGGTPPNPGSTKVDPPQAAPQPTPQAAAPAAGDGEDFG